MDQINLQIDTLALMFNNSTQKLHTDNVKKLLHVKQQNVRELTSIKKKNTPMASYHQAIKKLSWVSDSIPEPVIVYKNIVPNRDSVFLKQKKKKFLERLADVFVGLNKNDSNLHIRISESVQIDSLVATTSEVDAITRYITGIVIEIRDESMVAETRLNNKELEILANDLTLTVELRQML